MAQLQLTTVDQLKALLGITFNDDDALLDTLCTNITDFIQGYVQRIFDDGTSDLVEYYDGIGVGNLQLRQYPIISISDISYNAGTPAVPVWYTIDPKNYVIYNEFGYVFGPFPRWHRNIKVTYRAGYGEKVPAELNLLATQLAAKEYEMRNAQGKKMELMSMTRIDWDSALTPLQISILDDFIDIKL